MLSFIKKLFGFAAKEITPPVSAPYKIEAPVKKPRAQSNRNKNTTEHNTTTKPAQVAKSKPHTTKSKK